MSCCHYQPTGDRLDTAFTVDASRITFGRGCLGEVGDRASALGMTRVALFSDLVPHGMSVILNAPSVFRVTAPTDPQRHIEAAGHLGSDVTGAAAEDAGDVLSDELIRIMRAVGMPNGLSAVGYGEADCKNLADGAWPQQRLLQNAPIECDTSGLAQMFAGALGYW